MTATAGQDLNQLGSRTMLRVQRFLYPNPQATTVAKVVASLDPSSGMTIGTAFTLAATVSGLLLRRPRRITLVLTDASGGGGGLTVTVRLVGTRAGVQFVENITTTCTSGSATTTTSTKYYDQVLSVTPIAQTNAASGDALTMGIDGTSFGLDYGIKVVGDVISIINIASGTEAAPTAISSTTVDVDNSAIRGITLAATDLWEIRYIARTDFGFGSGGVFP